MLLLKLLDVGFLVLHTVLIVFNLFGWIWAKTRRLNLITLLLTGASWFGLGLIYGLGYCPFTDWHWQVKWRLGERNLPDSYIQYLIHELSGLSVSRELADALTAGAYFLALACSIWTNWRWRKPA